MTATATGEWGAVRTIMRWRMRMIRNSIATDSGFLAVFLGGLFYLAIVVFVAIQARAGAMISHELDREQRQLSIILLGMHLFLVSCIQGGALYFFRISLQGDFRTARWRALPVGRQTLRRAYLIDSLFNPGAIAALVATWLLIFGYAMPRTVVAAMACVLAAPIFVFLSQSIFVLAADLLNRFRTAGSWLLFLMIAAAAVLVSGYVVRLASGTVPVLVRDTMLSNATWIVLRLPPWGVPLFVLQRVDAGHVAQSFAALIAAAAGASLVLVAANRIAAGTELD
jgi:hypothetical protein